MNEVLALAKKIQALANYGHEGERSNAETKLRQFMAKHNITIGMLNDSDRKEQRFNIKASQAWLFAQVVRLVMGSKCAIYKYKKRSLFMVSVSSSEFIEIQSLFDLFESAYVRELKLFQRAFIHKNNIYATDTDVVNASDLDEKQRQELDKLLNMANGIDKVISKKQLTN